MNTAFQKAVASDDMKNFFTRCSIYDSPLIQKKYHILREHTKEMTKATFACWRPSTGSLNNSNHEPER